jgi:predicted porin
LAVTALLVLSAAAASCGGGGGGGADTGADAGDGAAADDFVLFTSHALDGVVRVASYGFREDGLFAAVEAGNKTGIYKLDIDAPELGWRQVYDQEGLICPVEDALIVALPPGKS